MPIKSKQVSGLTFAELITTICIAGIIAGLAFPSFMAVIRNNRLTAYTNDLIASLNFARSEAIKRSKRVTMRKPDNDSYSKLGATANWENGWDVFTDEDGNGNGKYGAGDLILKHFSAIASGYTIRANSGFTNKITFNEMGGSGSGKFVICDDSDGNGVPEPYTAKLISIITTGRARLAEDINNPPDGIPNTSSAASSNLTTCDP